jgi:alpha-tubulin suppressor-like RCC1 family protein
MNRGPLLLLGLVGACANILGFEPGELADTQRDRAGAAGESDAGGVSAEGGSGSVIPTVGGAPDQAGSASVTPCGNGRLDGAEECDGDELGDASCTTAGEFAGGTLGCDADCHYDFESCYSVESVAVAAHVCAVLSHGKLKCWGANDSGQLGLGDQEHRGEEDGDREMGPNLPFVPLGEARAQQVTVGAKHTCVLTTDGEVRCWGSNFDGQLGVPDVERLTSAAEAPVLDLGSDTVDRIEAGAGHTCARFNSGQVKCWGTNYVGQLGLEDTDHRGKDAGDLGEQLPFIDLGIEPVQQLSAGDQHNCALGTGGLKCWGATSYNYFMESPSQYNLGDEPREMGENLPLIELGWSVAAVTSGGVHNCGLSTAGSVKCWGDSSSGQLGYGSNEPHIDVALLAGLDDVDLDGTVRALSAGLNHTCALLTDNRLKCWGANEWGQLGLGDAQQRGFYPDEMGTRLPAVDLGRDHTIVAIQAGGNTNCAILDRGRVKCWGQNDDGALGLGHNDAVGPYLGDMGDALPFVELW